MQKTFLAAVVASVVAGQAMAVSVVDDGTNKFTVGGHVGMRYAYESGQKDKSDLSTKGDSSRINFQFESKLNEDVTAFARAEWGFDVTKHGEDFKFTNRLGFVGVKHADFGSISIGQQWSSYSTVAMWTDNFATTGGDASGMYGNWGDYNGTARANDALQYNFSAGGMNISAQFQAGGSAKTKPDNDWEAGVTSESQQNRTRDRSYGIAASYDLPMGLSFGGAYNQTKFVQSSEKDAKALVLAAKFDQGPIYAAFSFSDVKNHATYNSSTFEKARGYELYGSYQLTEAIKVGGGYNQLTDEADQFKDETQLKYFPVEVVYTAGPVQLSATYTVENSKRAGKDVENKVVAQIRYYF